MHAMKKAKVMTENTATTEDIEDNGNAKYIEDDGKAQDIEDNGAATTAAPRRLQPVARRAGRQTN